MHATVEAAQVLGFHATSEADVNTLIEHGIVAEAILPRLDLLGVTESDLSELLSHPERGTLTQSDGMHVIRIADVSSRARDVFKDQALSIAWLHTPDASLEGRTPLMSIKTDEGVEKVNELLAERQSKAA